MVIIPRGTTVPFIPPLPSRWTPPDDYCELGQAEHPRAWVPVAIGMALVLVLLVIATLHGKI